MHEELCPLPQEMGHWSPLCSSRFCAQLGQAHTVRLPWRIGSCSVGTAGQEPPPVLCDCQVSAAAWACLVGKANQVCLDQDNAEELALIHGPLHAFNCNSGFLASLCKVLGFL